MTDAAFSAGFRWGDVAPVATAGATAPAGLHADEKRRAAPTVSQVAATPDATAEITGFSRNYAWTDDSVATVATVAIQAGRDVVSQPNVAGAATVAATPKAADFRAFDSVLASDVARVATVADWVEAIELMARAPAPERMTVRRWRELTIDARALVHNWGADLHALGWTTLEVFGVNRDPRARRLDVPGLVYLLFGRPVEAIDAGTAVIRDRGKVSMTFHRKLVASGGLPVWEWVGFAHQRDRLARAARGSARSAYPYHPAPVNCDNKKEGAAR